MTATPRLLLLQARRPGDPMLPHEVRCFAEALGVDPDTLSTHDLTTGPPTTEAAARFDAVFVGGSGEFCMSERNLPQQDGYLDFLRDLVARRRPLFASCFGFQGLVLALGGEVIHDDAGTEVGSFELRRTAAGATDELFQTLPERFWAQLGHSDRATRLPTSLPNLAASELSPLQALRVPGAPIWGTQFHPELDLAGALTRFENFLEHLAAHGEVGEAESFRERLRDSPEASSLLRAFVKLVLG